MSVPLAFREHGSGPPIVVLPGLFGSAANWAGIARRLAGAYRVLAVDLRNHGNSPHRETMGYAEMAEDVVALMDRIELPEATVLGHSLGGKVAMTLALAAPRRVPRLIVVDIAPARYPRWHDPIIRALLDLDLSRVGRRTDADRLLAPALPQARIRQFLLQNLERDGEGYRWRIHLQAIARAAPRLADFPHPVAYRPFPNPVRFVAGAESSYLAHPYRTEIPGLFPRARIDTIPGAGHWLHAEQPEAFVRTVNQFLHETPQPAPNRTTA